MGIKHKEGSRRRWDNTSPQERARLGALHSVAVKKYWEGVDQEERTRRAQVAAKGRWNKQKQDLNSAA